MFAINELAYTQFLSETFGIFGGLIDVAYGDVNDFSGDGRANDFFLNYNFNSNPVGIASTPDVTLGGGAIYIPNEKYQVLAAAYNTEGSAGHDPFQNDEGTTFFAEGSRSHTLGGKEGKQTLGLLYGIDKERSDLFADPRLALESLITTQTLPTTDANTWAIYYSLQQYIQGNAEKGWGVFLRAGLSDGDPNPIENTLAGGLGGKGLFDSRPKDRFGIGAYWVHYSDDGLLASINIDINDAYGFEVFYSFEVTPWLKITPDLQLIESPLPGVNDTTIISGVRTKWEF